jgi:hypothetical protein
MNEGVEYIIKNMDGITKRLDAVAKKSRTGTETSYRLEYTSQATALAQTLTGMAIQTPERWEMTWGRGNKLPSTSDSQKLRWLAPYKFHPERLDAIRRAWNESPHERDKAALVELDRLQMLRERG